MSNGKPATEKQKRFATWIAQTLKIPMPSCDSCIKYSKWISDNIVEFRKYRDEAEALADLSADYDTAEADYYYDEYNG